MSKLNEKELLRQVEMWLLGCTHDTEIPYEGCRKCPSKKICKQATRQIKEMIKKPEVTEEWYEEQDEVMRLYVLSGQFHNEEIRKDFIRKLVEEVK